MGLGVFLVKEELSRASVDGPSPAKAETELQLVGPVSRRLHGDRSTWVFQSAGCSAEPVGAAVYCLLWIYYCRTL